MEQPLHLQLPRSYSSMSTIFGVTVEVLSFDDKGGGIDAISDKYALLPCAAAAVVPRNRQIPVK